MFKAIILLKRKSELTHEEFADWWLNHHTLKVKTLPNVKKVVFNLVDNDGPFDGVSELWFDSKEDFEAAYATPEGKAVAEDTLSKVETRERLFVTENLIIG